MRPILLLALICLASVVHSAEDASKAKKKITHHIQFLIGNYVSESIMYKPFNGSKVVYTPLYSYSVGFDYKVEFSEHFGLRTGVNYFTDGVSVKVTSELYGLVFPGSNPGPPTYETSKSTIFTSSILIPIHFMYFKLVGKGRLVFSAGPDIYLPTNTFGKENFNPPLGDFNGENVHSHTAPQVFFKSGNLGFTLGLGYEKKGSDKLSVEFMPDFRLLNALPFDFNRNIGGESVPKYTIYPFNMALGLSTYITFY